MAIESSGPSYSVAALCDALGARGNEVVLHVLEPRPDSPDGDHELRVYPRRAFPFSLARSRELGRGLREAVPSADVLHSHGLWQMPSLYAARAVRGTRCRLVMSPRGTLDPRARRLSRWRKAWFWHIAQASALRAAHGLHATAEAEVTSIRAQGLRAPVILVPNGVGVPREEPKPRQSRPRVLLFLARIHPIKGVDRLLRAWRRVQGEHPDWSLRIVGPDDGGHLRKMQLLARELGTRRAEFAGPRYGKEKSECYRAAELYILPTHAENFGLTVAEALAHGLPAIVGNGAPWQGLERERCGWWIDNDVDAVAACLREALSLPPQALAELGARGRRWVELEFSWPECARRMEEAYRWLLEGGSPPAHVSLRE